MSDMTRYIKTNEKKTLRETQTVRAGCSKAEPKIFAPPQPGQPKFNQLEMVATFTYKPSLVRINAPNLEVIVVTDPQTHKPIDRTDHNTLRRS